MRRISVLLFPIFWAITFSSGAASIDGALKDNVPDILAYYQQPIRCTGRDEQYYRELPSCQVYCEDLGKLCTPPTKPNRAGCGCRPGFARWRPTGQCISHGECNKKRCAARPNETYKYCGEAKPRSCEPTCGLNDNRPCKIQNDAFSAKNPTPIRCEEGCRCEAGYKINPQTGLCVHSHACPHPTIPCHANEEWRSWNPYDENCVKTKPDKIPVKNTYGCYCKQNYYRFNGYCIQKQYCGRL